MSCNDPMSQFPQGNILSGQVPEVSLTASALEDQPLDLRTSGRGISLWRTRLTETALTL